MILKWIVKPRFCEEKSLAMHKVTSEDLIDIQNDLLCWIFNTEVDINLLKTVMELDAFNFLSQIVAERCGNEDLQKWICNFCQNKLMNPRIQPSKVVMCESCLRWFHYSCVGLLQDLAKNVSYFCSRCRP